MKNTNIIIGIVVVVAIAVGGYFFWKGSSSTSLDATYPVGESPTEGDLSADSQLAGKKMAFSQFVKQGGSYKCTVDQYVGETKTQGITYINGGMIRGEYNTQVAGMNIDTTFIVRDGFSYAWSSAAPSMGFKSKIVENKPDGSAGASGSYTFNAEQIGDYNCEAWTADASVFTIPTSVTFRQV